MNEFDKNCLIYSSTGKMIVSFRLICSLFLLFTLLHLFANYSAVTSVVMETLNQARLHILVHHYLQTGEVLSLQEVNYKEPVLWSKCSINCNGVVVMMLSAVSLTYFLSETRRKLNVHLGTSIGKVFSR